MSDPSGVAHRWVVDAVLAVALAIWFPSLPVLADQSAIPNNRLQVVCAPDKPVAYVDDSVAVRAWATDTRGEPVFSPLKWAWSSSAGTITGDEVATWSFFAKDVPAARSSVTQTATLRVESDALGLATCDVTITLVQLRDSGGGGKSDDLRGAEKLAGRAFILPENHEPRGYGLYSYLLFDSPPINDELRARYLSAIASYLQLLSPIAEMERYRRRSQLNLLMLPVKQPVPLPEDLADDPLKAISTAEQVLMVYDYARAQSLLADLNSSGFRSGPYLLSTLPAGGSERRVQLGFDMSRVVPSLIPDWIRAFAALAGQERSWSETTVNKLALKTRNALAVMARDVPDVFSALTDLIKVWR
jgi:hypothetical protein